MSEDHNRLAEKIDVGFQRLHERLDEHNKVMAKLGQEVVALRTGCGPCRALLDKHEIDLRGTNGDGIKTRVALLEKTQEEIVDPAQRAKVAQRNAIGSFIAGAISAIAAIVAALFK